MSGPEDSRIAGIVERLLAATMPGEAVSLDTIGDHVGATFVTYEEIGLIFDALQGAGRTVADPQVDATQALKRVLAAARAARAAEGRTPSLQRLEQDTGLDRITILTALRFADTLRR